jgi:hypothetical protein
MYMYMYTLTCFIISVALRCVRCRFVWTSDHQSPNSKAGVVAEQSRARRSERKTLNTIFLDQKDADVCN